MTRAVEEPLFSITCTTCQARLSVRDEAAIGAILACPKCGSMVQVVPPPDWEPEPVEPPKATSISAVGAGYVTKESPAEAPSTERGDPDDQIADADAPTGDAQPADELAPPATEAPTAEESTAAGAAAAGPPVLWASPTELLWRKWLLWASGPVAGLVIVAGVWSVFFSGGEPEVPAVVERPAEPAPEVQQAPADQPNDPLPELPNRRWLPEGTRLFFSLRLEQMAKHPGFGQLRDAASPVWKETISPVLQAFQLTRGGVDRLNWASTDLAAWPDESVVVIRLQEGHDAGVFQTLGEPVDLHVDGAGCRRLPGAAWAHPFAIVDERTIVTGRIELLQRLSDRSDAEPGDLPIDRLWKLVTPDADVVLLVDLAAARQAGWRLPTTLLDVWPAGRRAWHEVWEMPQGVGLTVRVPDGSRSDLALVCEGETAADAVHAAVDELVPAARQLIAAQVESLTKKIKEGRLTAEAANRYELLLTRGLEGLQSARCEIVGQMVYLRTAWGRGVSDLALAALESRPAIRADWLAAAQEADRANHERFLAGLDGYQRAQGCFPAGAVGGAILPPDTRLSWIATMLPYYGHRDWHRRLEFGYPWNGPQNRPLTRQPLDEVVNPGLGPSKTEAGFPVTHYVGVAGVGPDAGHLKKDDPRAGVFGFGRTTRLADIADGASNTLAILGVSKQLGPWGAGGQSTVRGLTRPPYVNGPDGFGSGQPNGMLAGMADGSIRFISKDVDPRVLEQLATINGGGNLTVAALDQPPVKKTEPKQPPTKTPPEQASKKSPPAPNKPDQPLDKSPDNAASRSDGSPTVGVAARLAEPVQEIELRETPLSDAVDLLAQLTNLRITFDPDAMAEMNVAMDDVLTIHLSESTAGEILRTILAERGLDYVMEGKQILITGPEKRRSTLRRVRYTVSDLTGGQPDALAELVALVRKVVAPECWQESGGRGSIRLEDGALIVEQTDPVHYQVLTFCEKLRNARGKPLRSRYDPKQFTLATHLDRARARLAQPVTANFRDPTLLVRILSYLAESAKARILIDWVALETVGAHRQSKGKLTVEKQPLSTALDSLLSPLGLTYLIVDADTLQVTTAKAAAARSELEFHPAKNLLADDSTPKALIERIKGQLAGATWSDAGGPGVILFDEPSKYLIVLQSQSVQRALEGLLDSWRSEKQKKPQTGR